MYILISSAPRTHPTNIFPPQVKFPFFPAPKILFSLSPSVCSISISPHSEFPTSRSKAQNSSNKDKSKKNMSSPIINQIILQFLFWLSLFSVTFSLPNLHDPRGGNSNSSKRNKVEERAVLGMSLFLTM